MAGDRRPGGALSGQSAGKALSGQGAGRTPSGSAAAGAPGRSWGRYDDARTAIVRDTLRAVISALVAEAGRDRLDILDAGGGTGGFAVPLAGLGHNVTVIDPSPDSGIRARIPVEPVAEITLEANPGTVEAGRFRGFRAAGVNRISLGVQSFDDGMLAALGRIHSADEARRGVEAALASFDNVNLDLMYGLPQQTMEMAQSDIRAGLACGVPHLSAYQLTIEPNTAFYSRPPALPEHDACADMQVAVERELAAAGYEHYETSAFARPGRRCKHNLNYWEFGDYLGIGAGAHGKVSFPDRVTRHERLKQPRDYMASESTLAKEATVEPRELPFEFMLNALRLVDGFPIPLFQERTGLPFSTVESPLKEAERKGLIERDWQRLRPTQRGRLFLNELLALFVGAENADRGSGVRVAGPATRIS